jgi:4-amino-4-deoxy-L-arabinose transferase-like glycosyltransferase
MFNTKDEKRWVKVTLYAIIILALISYTYAIFKYGDSFLLGSLDKMDNDDVKYIRSAWTILDKGILSYHDTSTPTVFIMPGHPYVLAALMKVFGRGYLGITAFRILQVILQGFCLYIVFLIGREIFNSKVGLIACLMNLFYIPEVFATGMILTEVEFKFLLLLLVYISIYAVKTHLARYYISGGIIWGAACLFRPTIVLYPAVILIIWIVYKYPFIHVLKYTVLVTMTFCTVMSPWWIRNYKLYNRFIPMTLSSGNPFLQGTYINYDQSRDYTPYDTTENVIQNNKAELETGIYRLKTYFKKYPFQYIYWYTIGKTIRLWQDPFYWREAYDVSNYSAAIYHLIIIAFAITGAMVARAKRKKEALFVILPIIYFTLVYLPYYTFSRYVYPTMPFLMLLGSYGMITILNRWFVLE